MSAYLLRRLLYAVPVLIGANLLTFFLFFMVNTPDDMARMQLGVNRVTPEAIARWKAAHGYDKPLLFNGMESGAGQLTRTVFFEKSIRMFVFDFGRSNDGRDIAEEIRRRMGPSLAVAVPSFVLGLLASVVLALWLVFVRASRLDTLGVIACVTLMSVSSLFYIIFGQWLVAKVWQWVPVSGFVSGLDAVRFLVLPVLISVLAGLGGNARWYRSLFLEEIEREYVRTARAKGVPEHRILFRHVLPNASIPILTGVVVVVPTLFMGSLILESFFAIPGLGSYTIDAIHAQDFAIVRSMVFIGSILYVAGLILTDLAYCAADPRIRFS